MQTAEYYRAYRKAHREEVRKIEKRYYETHKNEVEYKARASANVYRWREKNREHYLAYQREYYRKKKATTGAATPTAAKED